MLGPDFCKNVAIGATTSFVHLFDEAREHHPDPNWDFEPDDLNIRQGTVLNVANEGGEPHTFTEVKDFGGGFIDGLNGGENTVPECAGGFANVAVARTQNPSGQQCQRVRSVERRTPLSVLHSSVDARDCRREVIGLGALNHSS